MKTGIRAVLWFASLSGVSLGQTGSGEPIKTTVCQLLQSPERFNGQIVQVRANMSVGFEHSALADPSCQNQIYNSVADDRTTSPELRFAYILSEADLRHSERLNWMPFPPRRPVELRENDAYHRLIEYVEAYYFDSSCPLYACPKYRVTAIFTGRFDYDNHRLRAVRDRASGKIWMWTGGFCHLNSASSQLVWQSVDEVVATPIPRSTYESRK